MKSIQTYIGLIVLLALLINGCSKEFTPEVGLLDRPVVYSILRHSDTKHYIRISRSFVQAITDQTIEAPVYNSDSLEVWLEIYRQNQRVGHPIAMTPELLEKDPGIFESKAQLIYWTEMDIVGDSECRLTVLNLQTGQSLSSSCMLLSLQGFKPMIMSNQTRLDFVSIPGVFFYEVNCLFHYVEVSETDTVFKSISYPIGTVINGMKDDGKEMSISLNRPNWWDFITRHITVNENVKRYAFERPLEFRLLIGDQYLFDYRRSFSGYETMIHTGQSLSNIQGGFGIFSAYDETSLFYQAMTPNWYDKLAGYDQTKDLNFANYPWK